MQGAMDDTSPPDEASLLVCSLERKAGRGRDTHLNDMDLAHWKTIAFLLLAGAVWLIARHEERRHITRYLRLGGARVISIRRVYSVRWQTYYNVSFEEHTGRLMNAVFSWQRKAGVVRGDERVLRQPGE